MKRQADNILPVKENQGTLYEDIHLLFDGFEQENYGEVPHDTAKHLSEGHDRREIRQGWVVIEPEYRGYLRRGQE